MTEKKFKPAKERTYRFDFLSDGKVCSVSFRGSLDDGEEKEILDVAGRCTYEKASGRIHEYLEQRCLKYSHFEYREFFLSHERVMEMVDDLLHSDGCIGSEDFFYAIMDHQKHMPDGCEGCYIAARRILSPGGGYRYDIIGQTFRTKNPCMEEGFFTIRRKDGERPFQNIAAVWGEPVLPAFGCMDLVSLVSNIGNISSAEQAAKIAVR